MAIIGGIVISDFFFVKKQRVSLMDLYNQKGAYQYWKGVNPSAMISLIVGTVVYWSLYNPLADDAHHLFHFISAGLPTYVVSGVCYYICASYVFSYQVDRPFQTESPRMYDQKTS
jgi:NCS1 family nucleobase:cation symporter-1